MRRGRAGVPMEIKTEKQEPDGEKPEVEQRVLPAGQAGGGPELQTGASLHPVKQEAEQELQQCWEAQWQRFLRTMQAPCPGWRAPQLPLLSPGKAPRANQTDCKHSMHPRREPAAQAWPSPAGEPCESRLDFSVQVKEEAPEEEEELEARCRRFRRFCYQEAEGPREACRQLQELCRQWLEPERHSKEQILERVTLEQFLAVLPPEMQSWVRESGPETCVQAVALAEDFLVRLERREQQFQKLQLVKEVIVHSPKAERDLLDAEDMQLSFDAEQDSDGEACLFKSENEEANLQLERPKKTEVRALSLDAARGAFPQVAEAGERPSSRPGLKPSQEISLGQTQGQHVDCREDGDRRSDQNRSQQPTPRQAPEKKAVECGKSYPLGLGLVQPAKAQSYECSYCGKRWPCQSQLRRHVKIHTGERPHKCTDCGKSFSTSSNLSQHKRVHTGERPYSCKDCGKSYRRRASLVQHERETCRKGSRFSAPAVGYVVLGNCTLLCMKKSTQGARNRVIAPKGGDPSLADQPLNVLTGYSQERGCAKD